jgi:RNA polymerase primary sigma factor
VETNRHQRSGRRHEDDMENSQSLAAIEAELKPKVVETFDTIADSFRSFQKRRVVINNG